MGKVMGGILYVTKLTAFRVVEHCFIFEVVARNVLGLSVVLVHACTAPGMTRPNLDSRSPVLSTAAAAVGLERKMKKTKETHKHHERTSRCYRRSKKVRVTRSK